MNPLLAQGMELRRRGWSVTIASPSRMRAHITRAADEANAETKEQRAVGSPGGTAVPANDLTPIEYMNLGDCSAIAELTEALERAADHENYMESQETRWTACAEALAERSLSSRIAILSVCASGAREMFHWALSLHHCMFSSLREQIPKLALRPNIIVVDFATYAGFDAADFFKIPFGPDTQCTMALCYGLRISSLAHACLPVLTRCLSVHLLLFSCEQPRSAEHAFPR